MAEPANGCVIGGGVVNWWERNFDLLELAKKFTELKFSLDCITMILNGQVERNDDLIL
jgi:hypothetical protein